jgi:hypothetical protein
VLALELAGNTATRVPLWRKAGGFIVRLTAASCAAACAEVTATVYMHTSLLNATMGVQLGHGHELIVKCPFSGTNYSVFTPCDPATFTVAKAGATVLRLRSIGWEKSFRAYGIAHVSFSMGG